MSQVITFYSYKGGVGRTMALANVGVLLSQWRYKVLIIDWDLEAPGIENFFRGYLKEKKDVTIEKGMLDILLSFNNNQTKVSWEECIIPFSIGDDSEPIHLITAGRRDSNYSNYLRSFNVEKFYTNEKGGLKLEKFRDEVLKKYDFILIDSRTGVTDFGGICTIQMPDILILLYTPTEQSMKGVKNISERAIKAQKDIPYDRQKLLSFPIPTRIDSQTEFKITQEWINKFSKELAESYSDWLPKAIPIKNLIELTKIPYIPFFSYGEQLPVVVQGTSDPSGLGYAYESIASLLANNLEMIEVFVEQRERYIKIANKTQPDDFFEEDTTNVFISYSHKDKRFASDLKTHLSVLRTLHNINIWDDSFIAAGDNIKDSINETIKKSDIFLFLISPDFMSSKWTLNELNYVLTRKENSLIIPIIARQADFKNTLLSDYLYLPKGGKSISEYSNKDQVYTEITKSIVASIEKFKNDKEKKAKSEQVRGLSVKRRIDTKTIKNLIAENRLKDAFDVLNNYFEENDGFRNEEKELVILRGEFISLRDSYERALIDYERYNLGLNKTRSYLIELVLSVDEKYTAHNNKG